MRALSTTPQGEPPTLVRGRRLWCLSVNNTLEILHAYHIPMPGSKPA